MKKLVVILFILFSFCVNAQKIEAEAYSNKLGVFLENTTDVGGGLNVGWIDDGDWMDYTINIPDSGSYAVAYRIASLNGNGELQLKSGTKVLSDLPVNKTGGWQSWQTIYDTVNLQAGTQTLRIYSAKGGWNLNWIEFNKISNHQQPGIDLTQVQAMIDSFATTLQMIEVMNTGKILGTFYMDTLTVPNNSIRQYQLNITSSTNLSSVKLVTVTNTNNTYSIKSKNDLEAATGFSWDVVVLNNQVWVKIISNNSAKWTLKKTYL